MSTDRIGARLACWLGGLWIVALAVRIVYLAEISDSPLWLVVMGDARSYDAWARRLAAGDWLGSEVFYQAPLYPYFLGAVYALIGDEPLVVRVVQSLLGATACVLLAIAGARLVTPRAGITAGLMLALYPPAIFFDGLIQKTTLTSFLLCTLLAITAGLARRPASIARWAAAGVTAGLLSLVRENALILALLAPLWAMLIIGSRGFALRVRQDGRRQVAVQFLVWPAAFLAGIAVVLVPVATRNAIVGGEWHLTTSQFGPNFYIGNNADADGFYVPLLPERGDALYERSDAVELAESDLGRSLTPREVSRYWTQRALTDIAEDPARWSGLLLRKLWIACGAMEIIDTEDQYTFAEHSRLLGSLTPVWHMGVLLPLAVFGAVVLLSRRVWRRRLAWPALLIAGYTASILLFFILGRYRFPLVPPMMLIAAAGLWEAVRIARRARLRRTARRLLSSKMKGVKNPVEVAAFLRKNGVGRVPRPLGPATLIRVACALLLAAVVAVPANVFPYPREQAMAITRENLGKHLYAAGFPAELALAQYDRAVALAPGNALLRANYAGMLWDLGRLDGARKQLELAARESPDDAATLVELGLLLRDLGEIDASAVHLRTAVAAAPESAAPPYHLAVTLLRLSEESAAEAAEMAIDQGAMPVEDEAAFRANVERAAALRTESAELLRRSIELEDTEAAHTVLAQVLARLGEPEDAAEEYAAAADLAPPGSMRQARLQHMQRRLAATPKVRRSAYHPQPM